MLGPIGQHGLHRANDGRHFGRLQGLRAGSGGFGQRRHDHALVEPAGPPLQHLLHRAEQGHHAVTMAHHRFDLGIGQAHVAGLDAGAVGGRGQCRQRRVGLLAAQARGQLLGRVGRPAQHIGSVPRQRAAQLQAQAAERAAFPLRQHEAERPGQRCADDGIGQALGDVGAQHEFSGRQQQRLQQGHQGGGGGGDAVTHVHIRMGDAHGNEKRQTQQMRLMQLRQTNDQHTADHRAGDPIVTPRQGLLQVAAQHHGDAQHQPVRVRGPRQVQAQHVSAAEREGGTQRVAHHAGLQGQVRAQRGQRPALGRDELAQLFGRQRRRPIRPGTARGHGGHVVEHVADAVLQRVHQVVTQVSDRSGHGGQALGQRAARGFGVRHGRLGPQIDGRRQRFERVGQLLLRGGNGHAPAPAGGVMAQQFDIEPARQQQVAQLDQAQQQVHLTAAVGRRPGGEDVVARHLQRIGQQHVVADRDADAGVLGRHLARNAHRPRAQPVHAGAHGRGQCQLTVAPSQQPGTAACPQRIGQCPGQHPGRVDQRVQRRLADQPAAVPGHREHQGQNARERHRPGAQAPGHRHQGAEGGGGDQHRHRHWRMLEQPDGERDDGGQKRCRNQARPDPRGRVRQVGQAGTHRAARRRQAHRQAEAQAEHRLHRRHAQRDADAVDLRGGEPAPGVQYLQSAASSASMNILATSKPI